MTNALEKSPYSSILLKDQANQHFVNHQVYKINLSRSYLEFRPPLKLRYKISYSENIKKRGVITGLSRKSAMRLRKRLNDADIEFNLFQTLTYPDEFFSSKTTSGKVLEKQKHIELWRRAVKRVFPQVDIVYRVEWMPRLSGKNVGEFYPHYHCLICNSQVTHLNFKTFCIELLSVWITTMHTSDIVQQKTFTANMDFSHKKKPFSFLINKIIGYKYISKYMSKKQILDTKESIGRQWGTLKKITELPVKCYFDLDKQDYIKILRIVRYNFKAIMKMTDMSKLSKLKKRRRNTLFHDLHSNASFFVNTEKYESILNEMQLQRCGNDDFNDHCFDDAKFLDLIDTADDASDCISAMLRRARGGK